MILEAALCQSPGSQVETVPRLPLPSEANRSRDHNQRKSPPKLTKSGSRAGSAVCALMINSDIPRKKRPMKLKFVLARLPHSCVQGRGGARQLEDMSTCGSSEATLPLLRRGRPRRPRPVPFRSLARAVRLVDQGRGEPRVIHVAVAVAILGIAPQLH